MKNVWIPHWTRGMQVKNWLTLFVIVLAFVSAVYFTAPTSSVAQRIQHTAIIQSFAPVQQVLDMNELQASRVKLPDGREVSVLISIGAAKLVGDDNSITETIFENGRSKFQITGSAF